MAGNTGEKITVTSDEAGKVYTVIDSTGQIHRGTVVVKAIYCGKHCGGCPHGFYKYVVWRQDNKTRWKYIGKIRKDEQCQPTQKNSGKA
jgi:hypothetical protein